MSIVTETIFNNFITINIHPADLSIIDDTTNKPKFSGIHAIRDAILAGETEIRSSVHMVTDKIDGGSLILVSQPIKIELPPNITPIDLKKTENLELLNTLSKLHQDNLKEVGDWYILPLVLEYIAQGSLGYDNNGKLYYHGTAIPDGIRFSRNIK